MVPDLQNLEPTDNRIERTIHMDVAFPKFKVAAPTLICIGNPSSGKSQLINDIFGVEFEVTEEGSAGLFHDSVDALFSCNEMPFGFNIFDFQGSVANKDFTLIESLLSHIPQAYLLLQVNDESYLADVIEKIDLKIR